MLDTYAHKSKPFYSPYLWLIALNTYDLLLFLTGKIRLNVVFIHCFIDSYKKVTCFYIFIGPIKAIFVLTARLLFLCRFR